MARSASAIMGAWPPYGLPALNAPFNILGSLFTLASTKWALPADDALESLSAGNATMDVEWSKVSGEEDFIL